MGRTLFRCFCVSVEGVCVLFMVFGSVINEGIWLSPVEKSLANINTMRPQESKQSITDSYYVNNFITAELFKHEIFSPPQTNKQVSLFNVSNHQQTIIVVPSFGNSRFSLL